MKQQMLKVHCVNDYDVYGIFIADEFLEHFGVPPSKYSRNGILVIFQKNSQLLGVGWASAMSHPRGIRWQNYKNYPHPASILTKKISFPLAKAKKCLSLPRQAERKRPGQRKRILRFVFQYAENKDKFGRLRSVCHSKKSLPIEPQAATKTNATWQTIRSALPLFLYFV